MSKPITTLRPWVRTGLPTAITAIDALSGAIAARASIDVNVSINGNSAGAMPVHLLGPGDVAALDPRQVIRTDPVAGAFDVEPNYFAFVELASAALPWLFTPAAPDGDKLRPWLVLVLLSSAEAALSPSGEHGLAVLRTSAAVLPDLGQSHLWAHAQATTCAPQEARELARIMCARQLAPATDYIAALVPAFETGRLAGLGLAVPPDSASGPAWAAGAADAADVVLPVYYSWTFRTGAGGDFESLAAGLKRMNEPLKAGISAEVARLPGATAATEPAWQCVFPGALGTVDAAQAPDGFEARLQALVNGATAPGLAIAPPLYGQWPAASARMDRAANPQWLWALNSNPQYRAAAAVGTRLVQEHQEALMTAAWRQIGEVEKANALLRQSQVARAASTVIHTRLSAIPAAALLQLAGPLLTRVIDTTAGGRQTIDATLRASVLPAAMVSGALRRALRPRGPLARRSGVTAPMLLEAVNQGTAVVAPRFQPDGILATKLNGEAFHAAARNWTSAAGRHEQGAREQVVTALSILLGRLAPAQPLPAPPPLPLTSLRTTLLAATAPALTVSARVAKRLTGPPGWAPADPLTPIMATPRIDTPLARHLIAFAPSLLLPGVADMPDEAVMAVQSNQHFIEALLVGANHELNRELLWRGFPTEQRATPLRRFWDRSATPSGANDDIGPIDGWTGELGNNMDGDGAQVVLVVRGQLLRRYPGTLIYAMRAKWASGGNSTGAPARIPDPGTEKYPAFTGAIDPDIAFAGFDFPAWPTGVPDPGGDPGWFFVFQQPPTDLRFGLDASAPQAGATGWDALNWAQAETNSAGYLRIGALAPLDIEQSQWDALTSASLAGRCRQKRFRACIHASDLLKPTP